MLPQPHYLNLEYFFYLIYRLITRPWSLAIPPWFTILWLLLIVIFWVVIVILALKIIRQRRKESADMKEMLKNTSGQKPERNERWEKVLKYLEGENPAEWKLAIIEADNMLDEVVKTLNPAGENLGERLKGIEPSDFLTLQDAWEAHKLRNRIAHESDFVLTKREALRAIGLFKNVFEEFSFI